MKSVKDRYLYKPNIGSSHWWATNKLEEIGSVHSVLDVGPGSGVFSDLVIAKGASHLDAIEIDQATREELKDKYTNITASLEELPTTQYDLVLCLDVLEHMNDPFSFLESLSSRINENGNLLISLPNIAHWSVRFQLLFGFFEYTDRGLLDRTHLQFFTRKRARQLSIHMSGAKIRSFNCSIEPVELLLPDSVSKSSFYAGLSSLRYSFAQILPGLMGYQHLVHIVK